MATSSWTLIDVDAGVGWFRGTIGPSATTRLAGADRWSVVSRVQPDLSGGGVPLIDVSIGSLSMTILPSRGMGLYRGTLDGQPIGWGSPVPRPINPERVPLNERNNLGWLHGFNELLCRCGLASNGPPVMDGGDELTLHGRIANLPAHRVEVLVEDIGPGAIVVRGVVDEASMFGAQWRMTSTYRFVAGTAKIEIDDRIENRGGTAAPLSLLYHINVGRPYLDDGATLRVPFAAVSPRNSRAVEGLGTFGKYAAPASDYAEQVYLYRPISDERGWSTALLSNRAGDRGFAVHYDARVLPCFTQWKNTQTEAQGYVTGLEPGTNFPNTRGFERDHGRLPMLAPGASFHSQLTIELASGAADVQRLNQQITELQQTVVRPVVHAQPEPQMAMS